MAAGPPPSPVPNHSELISGLVEDRDGARKAFLQSLATGPVEPLLTALKDESERLLVIDSGAAERLATALVSGAEAARLPRFGALGLMALGDAKRAQGHFPEAIELYDRAAWACRELGDEVGWARSRIGFVFAAHFCGRGREALSVGEEAYVVLDRHGEHLRAGSLSNNMGTVYYQLGEYDRALEVFDRAISHFERAGAGRPESASVPRERIGKVLSNQALVLVLQGRFDEAIELCQRAREIFVQVGELAQALRVDHYRASIYAGRGNYTRALSIQVAALTEFERAGLDEAAIQVTLDVIASHLALNHLQEARTLAEELIARCQALGTPTEKAKAQTGCAHALIGLGELRPALDLLDQAADVFARCGLSAQWGAATLLRARLQLAAGSATDAAQLADEACSLFDERGLSERRAQAQLIRARAALALDEDDLAEELARASLGVSQELGALPLSHSAHHVLAHVAERKEDWAGALTHYEQAIGELERVHSTLATELKAEFLGDKLEIFTDAIDRCLRLGAIEQAFGYLERAKSRALVEYLTANPELRVQTGSRDEHDLVEELARLRAEHAWFYSRMHGYDPPSADVSLPDSERNTLRDAIHDRERRIGRIYERLALLRAAAGLESLGPRDAHVGRTRPAIEPGTVQLEYVFWPDRGAVFVLTSQGMTVLPLAAGARTVRQMLGRWQVNLQSAARVLHDRAALARLAPNARGQLAALYKALIEPVRQHLRGAQRVIVVPYGPAHGVPFQALFDGTAYLIESAEVWTTPSSSLLQLCAERSRSGPRALVVGHSGGGRLPAVLDEARRVRALIGGELYLEDAATCSAVVAGAPSRNIVHLAAHADARLDNPTFAHLTLADGQLSMADVFGLRLDGALVTLSGCETGRSTVVGGDELIGLSRGFLFAGASTLVQSLWRVDDVSTAQLMERFYLGLTRSMQSTGSALRAAQRALISETEHPYLWAAFQLVGFGGPPRHATNVTTEAPRRVRAAKPATV